MQIIVAFLIIYISIWCQMKWAELTWHMDFIYSLLTQKGKSLLHETALSNFTAGSYLHFWNC